MNINFLARPNILALKPYTSARDEFQGEASVFLDANENSLGSTTEGNWNRYPDPYQLKIKEKLGKIKGVQVENIFLGNGSDEAIDLLFRIFCEPGKDKAIIFTPTYGMYEVSANINNVDLLKFSLTADFQLPDNVSSIDSLSTKTKLMFICSPNNPTGNLIDRKSIEKILNAFKGIVVIDEAYIDFSPESTWINELNEYPNLVILQTFSKAWGLAALRLGVAYASKQIIELMNKVKPPYNINESTQQLALKALNNESQLREYVQLTLALKATLIEQLQGLRQVKRLYPSDANFVLIEVGDANGIYNYLVANGVVVRNRHSVVNNCLRITIGTESENKQLIELLKKYYL